jgi:hypothetical protein
MSALSKLRERCFGSKIAEKPILDDSLKQYFEERKIELDKELDVYYKKKQLEFEIMSAQQLGIYEHEFHYSKEQKGIQLAKLDAEIAFKSASLKDEIIKDKDKTIETLKEVINSLAINKK